jgi:hypothetical protein
VKECGLLRKVEGGRRGRGKADKGVEMVYLGRVGFAGAFEERVHRVTCSSLQHGKQAVSIKAECG